MFLSDLMPQDDGTAIIGTMENVISMFAKMFGNEFELTTNGQVSP